MDKIESKVDKLIQIIEKYDIPRVADVVQKANNDIIKLNNECKEFIGRLNKAIAVMDGLTKNEVIMNMNDGKHNTDERIIEKEKEISSLIASEQLLLALIKDKDDQISNLRDYKEKQINASNEKNSTIQTLRTEIDKYNTIQSKLDETTSENTRLNGMISSIQSKCSDREDNLDRQCTSQDIEIRSKQDIISMLQTQLNSANESRTALDANLQSA